MGSAHVGSVSLGCSPQAEAARARVVARAARLGAFMFMGREVIRWVGALRADVLARRESEATSVLRTRCLA
jgi:hypothetical protein